VAANPQFAFWMDLLRANATPASMTIRAEPVAVRAFMKVLGTNTSLASLDLCNCRLQDDVGAEIGNMLATNTGLVRLDLDYNALGAKSLDAIATGLRSNRTLQSLSLEHNPLTGDDGMDVSRVLAFAAALPACRTLTSLNLYGTRLGRRGGRALAEALPECPGLMCMQLSTTDEMDVADLAAITDTLRDNARAAAEAAAAGKAMRAAARRVAAEKKKVEDELAMRAAEEAWLVAQKAGREKARIDAVTKALSDERRAEMEREVEYREMRRQWKEEAAAKEAKKADAGAKKAKKK